MASFSDYIREAMRHAEYESLESGEGWYAHIPGFKGLWASGPTIEDARNDLLEALDGWLYVNSFVGRNALPSFDNVRLEPPRKVED